MTSQGVKIKYTTLIQINWNKNKKFMYGTPDHEEQSVKMHNTYVNY